VFNSFIIVSQIENVLLIRGKFMLKQAIGI
jgi:hypothetical protein